MAEKQPIIVIKKKKGGHAGAHGGAWKVAYADFVTAMMAFFLVLWLLGSDEEIKASIAAHFSNPSSAWRPDLGSKEQLPLGDKTGSGDAILKGAEGMVPDDMVERPQRPFETDPKERIDAGERTLEVLSKTPPEMKVQMHELRFSVPEKVLFEPGSEKFSELARDRHLQYLAKLVKGYRGTITIQGNPNPDAQLNTANAPFKTRKENYEFTVTRVVRLMNFLVTNKLIDEARVHTTVGSAGASRKPSGEGPEFENIEFTFTRE